MGKRRSIALKATSIFLRFTSLLVVGHSALVARLTAQVDARRLVGAPLGRGFVRERRVLVSPFPPLPGNRSFSALAFPFYLLPLTVAHFSVAVTTPAGSAFPFSLAIMARMRTLAATGPSGIAPPLPALVASLTSRMEPPGAPTRVRHFAPRSVWVGAERPGPLWRNL